ncbi:MAG: class II aldolase/adducin family protein [Oscillospiraceae bacterium]|jgi:L-fuculose-phosphate aldolase|nr:class II aldolase/adducin family protein [Oscillospiraceae bacterium]
MSEYQNENDARRDILEVGRRLYALGFVAANDGNISVRVGENAVWATPTNVSKGFMTEDMLVKLDLNGNVLDGDLAPSSEIKMHLAVYRRNDALRAVVHAHPPTATAFAVAGKPLPKSLLAETELLLGEIPVAPFAPIGSRELADGVAAYCAEYNGVLMARHGICAWGVGAIDALWRAERIEFAAKVALQLKMLGWEI